MIALIYNWWSLFVRLAEPDKHYEAIVSRPLLLHGVGKQTSHAAQKTLTITSTHGCVFRSKVASDSGAKLPPIPNECCHPFR